MIIVGLMLFSGCTDDSNSVRTLRSAGYSNIKITGWEPFSCSEDDGFSTGFKATNPTGQTVTGVVCCGFVFKGCTIRF